MELFNCGQIKVKHIGIVTQTNMAHAAPSPVTTLNVFEIVSYLDNVTMETIIASPVLAVDESCSITNAANFMLTNEIDSLLVMRDDALVGIITIPDIFKTFIEMTGGGQAAHALKPACPTKKDISPHFFRLYQTPAVISYPWRSPAMRRSMAIGR